MKRRTKRIPFEQAMKLHQWRRLLLHSQEMIGSLQQFVERERHRLLAAHEFADIPADGTNLEIKLERYRGGPVTVTWEEEQDAAT